MMSDRKSVACSGLWAAEQAIEQTLADPALSWWLSQALCGARGRDPIDAANDANVLACLLSRRAAAVLDAGRRPGTGTPRALVPIEQQREDTR